MKRFALTICLAASLVFLLGVSAMAQDSLIVQSRTFGQNGSGPIAVKMWNGEELAVIVVPLTFREVTLGSYIAGMAFPPNGRDSTGKLNLQTGYLTGIKNANKYDVPDAVVCKGTGFPGGFKTILVNPPFLYPWSSPDAVLFICGVLDPTSEPYLPADAGSVATNVLKLNVQVTGTPGFFEIDTTCTDAANHMTFVDPNNAAVPLVFVKGLEEILANQCPISLAAASPVNVTVGNVANNQVGATDVEGDPLKFTQTAGKGSTSASGLWTYTGDCVDIPGFDVTIEVSDNQHDSLACDAVTFHVNVSAPAMNVSGCGDVSVHFGVLATKDVVVTGGCPTIVYSGGAPGSVDQNGHWTYETSCQDLGSRQVCITVTDGAQQTFDCCFNFTVTNAHPAACTNPADIVVSGSVVLGPAADLDGDPLVYTLDPLLRTNWPGEGITGNVYNSGTRPGGNTSAYPIAFTVSDGCSSAECGFNVIFEPPCLISIVDLDSLGHAINIGDYAHSFGGQNHTVGIYFDQMPDSIGGFDLLICYDQTLLRFIGAARGADLDPTWEYFTYRTGQFGGNCGGGCPNGYVKLVGIANMNNGVTPAPAAFWLSGVVATLTFYVDGNFSYIGLCAHIGFCSFDCTDNVLSSKDGTKAYFIMAGASLGPDYDSAFCMQGMPGKPGPVIPLGKFCPGAICIDRPIDDRGDINQNGVANEIGDAVLFSNYFIYGINYAFPNLVRRPAQILATDVNADGIGLTVADLVYLIRIITGDAQSFPPLGGGPKLSPYANSVDVVSNVTDGALTVTTNASVDLGGALFVYRFSDLTVGTPVLTAGSNLQLKSTVNRGELRILVYGLASGAKVPAGLNNFITIPVSGNGTIELAESQVSDNMGALLTVNATAKLQPTSYALLQNYPNPFNAGTVIQFSLKDASNWNLSIYNIAGQVVRTFNGNGQGNVSVAWDGTAANGSSVASGMYFYRLNAKDFTATKKMVLMK